MAQLVTPEHSASALSTMVDKVIERMAEARAALDREPGLLAEVKRLRRENRRLRKEARG